MPTTGPTWTLTKRTGRGKKDIHSCLHRAGTSIQKVIIAMERNRGGKKDKKYKYKNNQYDDIVVI